MCSQFSRSPWRVAHLSLPIGAILMFAVAPLLASFAVAGQMKHWIAILLIVSGYSFAVALPLTAMVGERGLTYRGPLSAKVVFVGNTLGAVNISVSLRCSGLRRVHVALTQFQAYPSLAHRAPMRPLVPTA